MTEDEAKTKWCPQARVLVFEEGAPSGATANRNLRAAEDAMCRCIGSACMAWRERPVGDWASEFNALMAGAHWIEAIKLHRNHTGSTLKDAKDYVDAIRQGREQKPTSGTSGYCGLAGAP